jgi:hypothetical protein
MQPELPPSHGEYVAATDYDALAAEVSAQRETIAGLTARVEAIRTAVDRAFHGKEVRDPSDSGSTILVDFDLLTIEKMIRLALSGDTPDAS